MIIDLTDRKKFHKPKKEPIKVSEADFDNLFVALYSDGLNACTINTDPTGIFVISNCTFSDSDSSSNAVTGWSCGADNLVSWDVNFVSES